MEGKMATRIGGMWKKTSAKGEKYFSGQINWKNEKINFVAFMNQNKQNEKFPDLNIYLSQQFNRQPEQKDQSQSQDIPF